MFGDMKTSFQDALKSTEPLPMPQVTAAAEILAALEQTPALVELLRNGDWEMFCMLCCYVI